MTHFTVVRPVARAGCRQQGQPARWRALSGLPNTRLSTKTKAGPGVRSPRRAWRAVACLAWLVCLLLGAVAPAAAQAARGAVFVLAIDGVIGPPTSGYLERALAEAARQDAQLVVIALDTPGGLVTSTREMTQAILASPVPVAVYVTPSGARAASAGLFLLASAHVAAMAPGSNTGAAHPVGLGEEAGEVEAAKAVNDAAASIRALGQARGRNVEWLEQAVRESVSVTAEEALDLGVIDVIAVDLDSLLVQLDGRSLQTASGPVTLAVAEAPRHEAPMNFAEQVLHVISDPNIAFVLLSVGSLGLIAELYNPGSLIPGISGAIALILAFYSLGNLPTNWAGVALLGLGLVLFVAELNTEGTGFLGIGALVAFVLGGLLMFRPFAPVSPEMPAVAVNPWLLVGATAVLGGSLFVIVRQVMRARRAPVVTGPEQFIGRTARVHTALAPRGRVWFEGQTWHATLRDGGGAPAGATVRIVGRDGLTLLVEAVELTEPAGPPAPGS
jgi:membrane-bound serine protease (ClpP class)